MVPSHAVLAHCFDDSIVDNKYIYIGYIESVSTKVIALVMYIRANTSYL